MDRRGKSRLRGVEAELDGGLEGGLSEVSEEVADLSSLALMTAPAGAPLTRRSRPDKVAQSGHATVAAERQRTR